MYLFHALQIGFSSVCVIYLFEEPDTGEKKRAMAIDSPGNVKEPDEADDKTKEGRSKTVGDIEGSATVKVHVKSD